MTLTLDLQPDIERGLSALARAKGLSLADLAQEVLAREGRPLASSHEPTPKADNLYELFAPVRGLLTDEEVDLYFSRTPSLSRPKTCCF